MKVYWPQYQLPIMFPLSSVPATNLSAECAGGVGVGEGVGVGASAGEVPLVKVV